MTGWRRLVALAEPRRRALLAIALLSVAGVGLELLAPWPLKLVIDSALSAEPLPPAAAWLAALPGAATATGLLAWLSAGTVILFLVAWGSRVAQSYLQAGAGEQMTCALAGHLFERLQAMSPAAHARHSKGDLVKRVTSDSGCVRTLVFGVCIPLLAALLSLVAVFAVMWRLDPALASLAVAAGPAFALCLRRYARPMEQRSYEQAEAQGRILAAAEQTLTAVPIVRAFGREQHEDQRFSHLCRLGERAYVRTLMAQLRFKFSAEAVTAAGTAAVIAVGGAHALAGRLSAGTLFVFISYLAALYAPLQTLAYMSDSIAAALAGRRRLLEILDETDPISDAPGAIEVAAPAAGAVRLGAAVRFEAVTFGYRPGAPVLEGLSLEVRPGEMVALVGASGAGKSTLVSLIGRYHDVARGGVLFDGTDVRRLRLESLRRNISVVHQEPLLFPITVAENIRYGRPDASDEEVRAAAAAAGADAFICRLPQGYRTQVGERGATLSGGERQRVAIARALLKDAPLLILDEPTAALDVETEHLLLEALEPLTAGRTSIIIAHRLSTIRRADRVMVLERGRIVEEGSHQELHALGGRYARSCDLQAGAWAG